MNKFTLNKIVSVREEPYKRLMYSEVIQYWKLWEQETHLILCDSAEIIFAGIELLVQAIEY